MKRRYRTLLGRETFGFLALAGFVFGAAMIKEMNLLVLMAGMLVGLLVVSWRTSLGMVRGLQLRRRMPHGICAGDLLAVSIDLTSTRRFGGRWAVAVEDQIRREGDAPGEVLRPNVWFPYLGPRQSSTQIYRGRLPRRGRYRLGPLTASTRFPFGLLRRTCRVDASETLLVYPRLGRLARSWNLWRREVAEGARRRERQQGRSAGEFFGVRQWHPGDSSRWIHWRSSAKHGTLVVRQFEKQRSRQFAILLDLWLPEKPTPEQVENVELAVSFTATLVANLCQQETNQLLLALSDPQPRCLLGPASASLREDAMQHLALVDPSHEDRLPALLDRALDRMEAGAQIVLVSTRENDIHDPARWGPLWKNASRRMLLRQIRRVNTADPSLEEYFEVDS